MLLTLPFIIIHRLPRIESFVSKQPSCRAGSSRRSSLVRLSNLQPTADTSAVHARGRLGARIVGVGSCAPSVEVSNKDLTEFLDTSDEWIMQRTGISKRRIMPPSQSLCDIATGAAINALRSAKIEATAIELVILATSSPDDLFGDAAAIAASVGAHAAVAFDLTAACSGFLFAVITGAQYLHSGAYSTALVIGADALSRWIDWRDRNTCILFGDGAGAVVMRHGVGDSEGVLGFELKSNGQDRGYLRLAYNGLDHLLGTSKKHQLTQGSYAPIKMNGREVYKFATREVPLVIDSALKNAGLTAHDIDWLLLHQANIRIMETVADRLGLPHNKIISNLSEYGNTSAGSIPIALEAAVSNGQVGSGDIIACAGFGAGLSWGAAIIRWG